MAATAAWVFGYRLRDRTRLTGPLAQQVA